MLDKRKILTIKSSLENLYQVENFIDLISDEYNISNTYFGNILIAVTEAVNNAICHGNKNISFKNVTIIFETRQKEFAFTIIDEGDGFDYSKVTDPTDFEHNTNANEGRGIFLMTKLADHIKFFQNGSRIELIFEIASINAELALNRIHQLNEFSKINSEKKINK